MGRAGGLAVAGGALGDLQRRVFFEHQRDGTDVRLMAVELKARVTKYQDT
jgi:hypothetical protein